MKKLFTTLCIMLVLVALICSPAYAGNGNNPLSLVSAQSGGADLAGAELAAGTVVLTVTFDRGMVDNFAANKECIKVLNAAGEEVGFTIKNPSKSVYVLSFEAVEGDYSLILGAGIKANNGNTLGTEHKIDFKVKAAAPVGPVPVENPAYNECAKDEACPIAVFKDSAPTAWYHNGVHFCLDNGLMKGTGDDTFSPEGTVTRAMIVAIIYRMEGSPAVAAENPFTDVAPGMWYTNAIVWASENNIVKGYEGNVFKPDQNVTREQFAAILFRYATYKEMGTNKRADLSGYTDMSQISSWALEPMQWCNGKKLINGRTETELAPAGNATRAEAATIFMRFTKLVAE